MAEKERQDVGVSSGKSAMLDYISLEAYKAISGNHTVESGDNV